jgi:hypothetical protein
VLPWSLHSVADVRAARTEEKVGHSSRDDGVVSGNVGAEAPTPLKKSRRDDKPEWAGRAT